MRRALVAALALAFLGVGFTALADATIRGRQWPAEVVAKGQRCKSNAVMDDRSLHCHNTRRVGLKCHRGKVYNGPR